VKAGAVAAMLGAVPVGGAVEAQNVGVVQSEILVLNQERLFAETQLGQRMTQEYQAAREQLSNRNRQIEAELEAEEQALTEQRATLSPEEFRQLADEFDSKVQRIRRDSDRAVRNLERRRELAPVSFMRQVEPILVQILQDTKGVVIMDARSVLLRADVVDITDLAITRIDRQIGDGAPASGAETVPEDGAGEAAEPEQAPAD
jgi:Skp family chaperone for outer membrane proteins